MKYYLIALATMLPSFSFSQYQSYRSKLECTTATKEEISYGYARLQEMMEILIREKKLFGYYAEKSEKGKSTFLTFNVLAEDEAKFKNIVNEWISRSKGNLMDSFWKGCPGRVDSLANNTKLIFPAIKNPGAPVAVVPIVDEKLDPTLDYKIVYDFTAFSKLGEKDKMDSSKVNWGLEEAARHFNLHVAAGVPKEKVKMTLVIHAAGSRSFFTNEEYQKRYKRDNPNLGLINELTNAGVRIVQCGQSAVWMGFNKEMFIPQVKIAMSAKTAISAHQMQGYALLKMTND